MIEFTKINIEGFASIGNLDLPLNQTGTTIIRAANGFGKSSVLNALIWCLYGKTAKGISQVNTWDSVKPKEYHGTKVQVFFRDDKHSYSVIRCQSYSLEVLEAKGANRLIFLVDADVVNLRTKPDIQKEIEKTLKMSYDLFMNTIMFGQGMQRMIQASGSDQKALFEEIFDLNYLTKAKKIAQEEYKECQEKISDLQISISAAKKQIESYTNSLKSIKEEDEQWETRQKNKIKRYTDFINASTKELSELRPRIEDPQEYRAKIEELENRIEKYEEMYDKAERASEEPLSELVNKIIKWLQMDDKDKALKYLRNIRSQFATMEKCNSSLRVFRKDLQEARIKLRDIEKSIDKERRIKKQIQDYKAFLEETQKEKKPRSKSTKEFKKEIEYQKEQVRNLDSQVKPLVIKRDNYKWAVDDPLSNNGIKAFLFESSLDSLNDILKEYSEILGFNIQFGVDMESARKDFVVHINFEGEDVKYEELSGGQKQLVAVAMAFAMNESMYQANHINVTFLDEVFESLSSDNVELVCALIRKIYKERTLFLITHQDSLPLSQARVLEVVKEKGISQYHWR